MESLIAIDPGKKACAWARFLGDRLLDCGLAEDPRSIPGARRYIVELPQVYRHSKGDPNDLIVVAFAAGVAVPLGKFYETVLPRTWKGQTPKAIHTQRVLRKLTSEELAIFDRCSVAKSLRHNVIDAIGIGLWRLGR